MQVSDSGRSSRNRRFASLLECDEPEQIADALQECAASIGFPSAQMVVSLPLPKPTLTHIVQQTPKVVTMVRSIQLGPEGAVLIPTTDPVFLHLRSSSVPIVWDRDTYLAAEHEELYDSLVNIDNEHTGAAMGLMLPVDHPNARARLDVFLSRVDRISADQEDLVCGQLAHLASFATDCARRVLIPRILAIQTRQSLLTPLEIEVLLWASRGYTVPQTARQIQRSESSVSKAIQRAYERLDCANKMSAVQKCLDNGWLPWERGG